MLCCFDKLFHGTVYIEVHSVRGIRPESRRVAISVSFAKARLRGWNMLTSRGWNMCEVCGGRRSKSIACSMQKAITFAVKCFPTLRKSLPNGMLKTQSSFALSCVQCFCSDASKIVSSSSHSPSLYLSALSITPSALTRHSRAIKLVGRCRFYARGFCACA